MKSVMSHQFNQVPRAEIERSSFDRSHGYKTAFNAGYLIPFYIDEALPGDTFNLKATIFARVATLLKPPMDNMFLDTFFFSVPYRLVWDSWARMNGERANPDQPVDVTVPQCIAPVGGYQIGSLQDYLGLPTGVSGYSHSALPLRAINLIFNEWFRDQNLQDSLQVPTGDSNDPPSIYTLLKRNKRHDYFTSCLPWPQKSDNPVSIPLGTTAPVVKYAEGQPEFVDANGTAFALITPAGANPMGVSPNTIAGALRWKDPRLEVDLTSATAVTINALRDAVQTQRLYERDARGGTRYPEIIKAHFGVTDPQYDVLQRPLYLGGGRTPVNINTVPQASPTGTYANTPQGNLAAFGTINANNHGFTRSFTEHNLIVGFCCVTADLTYQQGLNRMWSRKTRFDHYWPALSHLGEEGVLNKEIYTTDPATLGPGGGPLNEEVFGYNERYASYKYKPSLITGALRSTYTTSLDIWHLSQEFANCPVLNEEFIQENPPVDRIVAVTDEPQFIMDSYIKLTCARPMPVYSVPGMMDHF